MKRLPYHVRLSIFIFVVLNMLVTLFNGIILLISVMSNDYAPVGVYVFLYAIVNMVIIFAICAVWLGEKVFKLGDL